MPSSQGEVKESAPCPSLRHVKEPSNLRKLRIASYIPGIVPSFACRGLSRRLVCAAPLEMKEGTHSGKNTICLKASVL